MLLNVYALSQIPFNLCFACNVVFSPALREDRYFIAGRAIAVSLVHGGPSPGFLSPTLCSCVVGGKDSAKPVLEDIADFDLYEKVKKVILCSLLLICSVSDLHFYTCVCMGVLVTAQL